MSSNAVTSSYVHLTLILLSISLSLSINSAASTGHKVIGPDNPENLTSNRTSSSVPIPPNSSKIESIQISRTFANFLAQNDTLFRQRWGSDHEVCYRECTSSVQDLRNLQRKFQAKSLMELYYYLQATDQCFCVNSGSSYQWLLDLWGVLKKRDATLNTGQQRESHGETKVEQVSTRSSCAFENAINLIITLVEECRITTLGGSHSDPDYICEEWFCRS